MTATKGLIVVTARGILLGSVGVDAVVRSMDTEGRVVVIVVIVVLVLVVVVMVVSAVHKLSMRW